MKTTIDIADALLDEARAAAAEEGTTLRSLVEEALRAQLDRRRERRPYVLEDLSVDGGGMRPEFVEGGWDRIAQEIYREDEISFGEQP
ncbi:MAG TPA: type II toxin-antitoxin system VapB family antitoxin [Actinomycetales bacterium]|nr:type II toxin-antitoxin system VapB family antitoxin [Actinomycetales bacterium]